MAWVIGDSFDFYSVNASEGALLWDTATASFVVLAAGRFAGSQGMTANSNSATTQCLAKSSGSNDATHHIVLSFNQLASLGAATNTLWITFFDGATAQCSIVFRLDGSIILVNGASSGTIVSTYTSAFSSAAWTAFEFEVTINNTTGAWHVRKDGATSDSFSASSLDTQNSANAYANKIALGSTNSLNHRIDDFIWFTTAGAAPNTWMGDVRATQQMPISNSGTMQFSAFPNPASQYVTANTASTSSRSTNTVYYHPFIAVWGGSFTQAVVNFNAAATGNVVLGIYDATGSGGAPGAKLFNSSQLTNPVAGLNTFSITGSFVEGATYYIALSGNMTYVTLGSNAASGVYQQSSTYNATLPSNATVGTSTAFGYPNAYFLVTPDNFSMVNELIHNDTTDYVYDATVGHGEFYNVAPLAYVPVSIVAVQTRAFVQKSDAGARTLGINMKSGAVTNSASLALSTTVQHMSRVDVLDPNTGVAWTASGVNAITVGPSVVA